MSLKGKTALVTGSSRGLGKAIALAFAAKGAKVAINYRASEGEANEVVSEIKAMGGEVLLVRANIGEADQVKNLIDTITQKWGQLDILVNNAGITSQDKFADIALDRWNLIVNVNLNGSAYCAHAVLPQMIARNSGVIINMSSILATRVQYSVVYGATKIALERYTSGLARELRRTNISVCCMKPFFAKTEVVTGFLEGKMDMSEWEEPEMWGKYCTMMADADPQITTGKIFDQALCKTTFGPWQ
jgi:NAD(P)-dependent dehydrogenase (short-subunit alcohol dehydrogenase family)